MVRIENVNITLMGDAIPVINVTNQIHRQSSVLHCMPEGMSRIAWIWPWVITKAFQKKGGRMFLATAHIKESGNEVYRCDHSTITLRRSEAGTEQGRGLSTDGQ